MYPLSFDTYQDVKSNLALTTVAILFCSGVFLYWLLPEQHRALLRAIPLPTWAKGVAALALLSVVSGILIYGIQIHDRVYDEYVVKWRESYDVGFILPTLCEPFSKKLDPRFYEVAAQHRDEFMESLYYRYVRDRDTQISKNTLVRFYERVTNYWAIQVLEIMLYLLLVVSVLYFPMYRRLSESPTKLFAMIMSLCLGLMVTNFAANRIRKSVQEATEQEIIEIHTGYDESHKGHLSDLEFQIQRISAEFKLKYG